MSPPHKLAWLLASTLWFPFSNVWLVSATNTTRPEWTTEVTASCIPGQDPHCHLLLETKLQKHDLVKIINWTTHKLQSADREHETCGMPQVGSSSIEQGHLNAPSEYTGEHGCVSGRISHDSSKPHDQKNNGNIMKKSKVGGSRKGQKWISEVVQEAMVDFAPDSVNNPECNLHSRLYRDHLNNFTLWAVQMLDSSGFAHGGLLSGDAYGFGQFEQCLAVDVPQLNLKGKYCFVKLRFSYKHSKDKLMKSQEVPHPFDSVWTQIMRGHDPNMKPRDTVYWAVCMPSGCSPGDLERSLSHLLTPRFRQNQMELHLSVQEDYCQEATNFYTKLTVPAIVVIITLALFVLVALSSTMAGTYLYLTCHSTSQAWVNYRSCWFSYFSIVCNYKKLLVYDKCEYELFSRMKFLCTAIIIFFHRVFVENYRPAMNAAYQEQVFNNSLTTKYNGFVAVDTFPVISGFLTFMKILSDIDKGREINIPLYIFYRYGRIIPVYLTMMVIWSYIFPLISNGPLINVEFAWMWNSCKKNMWTHLLFINNYYNDGIECFLTSWYLALDMQLYLFCVLLGFIFWRYPRLGVALLHIAFLSSLLVPALITYRYGYAFPLRNYLPTFGEFWKTDDYRKGYIPLHMRASPYLIGMMAALFVNKLKEKNIPITKFQRYIGLCTVVLLWYWTITLNVVFPAKTESLGHALYVALHKLVWSIGVLWFVLVQVTAAKFRVVELRPMDHLVSTLSKLSLCAMLVHVPVQTLFQRRTSSYFSLMNITWLYIGDMFLVYAASLLLHLVIEAPLARLLRDVILRRKNKNQ